MHSPQHPEPFWKSLLEKPAFWVGLVWLAVYMGPWFRSCVQGSLILHDPDSWMRLARISDLCGAVPESGSWFTPLIPRVGPPGGQGLALHWTRLPDVFFTLVGRAFSLFLPFQHALVYGACLVNALWILGGALVLVWGGASFWTSFGQVLAGLLFLTSGWMLGYGSAFHPDHHSMLVFFLAAVLACLVRARVGCPGSSRRGMFSLAGIFCALGLWTSFEWIMLWGVIWAGGMIWAWQQQETSPGENDPWAWLSHMTMVTGLALPVCIVLERGPEWMQGEYDRLSWFHEAVVVAGWAGVRMARFFSRTKSVWIREFMIWGTPAALAIAVLFSPGLRAWIAGWFTLVDPDIGPVWHDHVSEILPLFEGPDRWGALVYALGHPLLVFGFLALKRLKKEPVPEIRSPVFLASLLGLLVYIPAALAQIRHTLFAQGFSIIPLITLLDARFLRHQKGFWRMAGLSAFLLFPTLGAGLFSMAPRPDAPVLHTEKGGDFPPLCQTWDPLVAALPHLEQEGGPRKDRPDTLFLSTLGVESTRLLFETPWRVLGVPYHRHTEGILLSARIFSSPPDEAMALLRRNGISFILFARDHLRHWMTVISAPHDAFAFCLLDDHILPSGLFCVPLPDPLGERFVLVRTDVAP